MLIASNRAMATLTESQIGCLSRYCTNLAPGNSLGSDGTVLFAAGDGRDVQRVYVAHSPSQGVVVAYQGEQEG